MPWHHPLKEWSLRLSRCDSVTIEWTDLGFISRTDPTGLREEAGHEYLDDDELIPDYNGNLRSVSLIDADGNVREQTMTYDEENRLTSTETRTAASRARTMTRQAASSGASTSSATSWTRITTSKGVRSR